MYIFLPLLAFCAVLFLFSMYVLSYDDVVISRKNIAMEQVFNMSFVILFVGLFMARLVYVLFHWSYGYLHPLVFSLFPYFPGLSMIGGVVGTVLFSMWYLWYLKKITVRIFDFFIISFMGTQVVMYVSYLILHVIKGEFFASDVFFVVFTSVLFLFFTIVLLPRLRMGEVRDGTITLLYLLSFSVIQFLGGLIGEKEQVLLFLSREDLLMIALFLGTLLLLLKQEHAFKTLFSKR